MAIINNMMTGSSDAWIGALGSIIGGAIPGNISAAGSAEMQNAMNLTENDNEERKGEIL